MVGWWDGRVEEWVYERILEGQGGVWRSRGVEELGR